MSDHLRSKTGACAALVVALAVFAPLPSAAQPIPAPAPPGGEQPPGDPPGEEPAPPPRIDRVREAMSPRPGGLTLDMVATRAATTSHGVAEKRAELEAAAGEVDRALVAYFPTLTLAASYTRLSPVDNTIPTAPGQPALEFPSQLNSYQFSAGLVVPISDYLLRLTQSYASASKASDARALEARAEAAKARADAQLALLEWLRARGQLVVTGMAEEQSRAHVARTKDLREVGVASETDELRLDAQLASAEHLARTAGMLEQIAAEQLRTLMHSDDQTPIASAVDVMQPAPEDPRKLADLQRQAFAQRLELKALDHTERSLDEADTAAHAGYYPRLDAFANALVANPNPRVFTQSNEFGFTWDVGVRLTWVINESFASGGTTRATRARMDSVKERKGALRDAIRLEVTRAYFDAARARSAIIAANRREVALESALQGWLDRYAEGKAKSTDIVDAETELTRARLERVDAHIDVLASKVRLDHAIGAVATR